jgi:hypothetical protein
MNVTAIGSVFVATLIAAQLIDRLTWESYRWCASSSDNFLFVAVDRTWQHSRILRHVYSSLAKMRSEQSWLPT